MTDKSAKALRDKLRHLKSGRDSHVPVQDKTSVKDISDPKLPNIKTPRMKPIEKSNGMPPSMAIQPPIIPANTTTNPSMAMSKKDEDSIFLLNALEKWSKSDGKYLNRNMCKSDKPLMKPFKSDAQRRAMYAAAEGKSNIGIPEKVGEEYIEASKNQDQSKLPEKIKKNMICKSLNNIHCLCESCRHSPELMRSIKMACMCDKCCP